MTSDRTDIEAVLGVYFDGLYESDPKKIAQVFHECFHMFSVSDGQLRDMDREAWMKRLEKLPSAKAAGQARGDWIVTIDQSGPTTAFAKVNCQLPPRFFTDYLTLVKLDGQWKIVSKTFHTEMR